MKSFLAQHKIFFGTLLAALLGGLGVYLALNLGAQSQNCHAHHGTCVTTSTTSTTATTDTTTTTTTTTTTPTGTLLDEEFNDPAGTQPGFPWTIFGGSGPPRWGDECFVNDAAHISEDGNGNLVETATYNPGGVPCSNGSGPYESGGMDIPFANWTYFYGTAEASIMVPCSSGTGLWPAWWSDGPLWPNGGEIDNLEIGKDAPMAAQQTLHGPTTNGSWQLNYIGQVVDCNTFHTYSSTWSPGQIVFSVDGVAVKTYTSADMQSGWTWPFDTSGNGERLFLDLQVGGCCGGTVDPASLPQSMVIDWVRVSQ